MASLADQSVVAIHNARRLFDSAEARTRELAKSLEDLRTTRDRLAQTQKLDRLGPAREVAQIGAALRLCPLRVHLHDAHMERQR